MWPDKREGVGGPGERLKMWEEEVLTDSVKGNA